MALSRTASILVAVTVLLGAAITGRAASEHYGQVVFGTVPVPGVTVTASQGEKQVVTSTDQQGVYKFADLADGSWMLKVEMVGFSPLSQPVTVAPDSAPSTWELKLRPLDELARESPPAPAPAPANTAPPARGAPSTAAARQPAPGQRGFQRADVTASAPPAAARGTTAPAAEPPPSESPLGAADGLLVNGSVNNGAASPFAQLAAFGNNRRGGRSLYTGSVGAILGYSAWDARPFSFTSQDTPKPSYNDTQIMGNFGGPLKIPGMQTRPNLFVGFQRTSNHDAQTVPAVMPTTLERQGNFSQTLNSSGEPQTIVDPLTRLPFPGNTIPRDRISPQAAALLSYYPQPNIDTGDRVNYQAPLVTAVRQDAVQSRITQPPFGRNQMFGNVAYQRTV